LGGDVDISTGFPYSQLLKGKKTERKIHFRRIDADRSGAFNALPTWIGFPFGSGLKTFYNSCWVNEEGRVYCEERKRKEREPGEENGGTQVWGNSSVDVDDSI
jgi:hypothetical protein